MTAPAPAEQPDPLKDVKDRLRRAAYDLEDAAQRAEEAISSIGPEDKADCSCIRILPAIERMHEDEHTGPMRWCTHAVCREALS